MDRITRTLQAKLDARAAKGLAEYGVALADAPLTVRDVLIHAQEEALDLAAYLQWLIDRMPEPGALVDVRIVFPHALDRIERHPDLAAAAAAHPTAKRVELVSENGGFY